MIPIPEKFLALEPEKQKRILNAAYREFTEQGFDKASTNKIVKEAGIGKGMLFYYFTSKKELYHYLIKYGTEFILNEYLHQIDDSETDFIEIYRQAARIKMKAYIKNPHVFNFFGTLYVKNGEEYLPQELLDGLEKVRELWFAKLFSTIDTSLFREDIPCDKTLKLITWTLDGYEKELVNSLKGKQLSEIDFDPYWEEFYQLLNLLKKIYYKNESSKKYSSL